MPRSSVVVVVVVVVAAAAVVVHASDRFYMALLSSLEQTHCDSRVFSARTTHNPFTAPACKLPWQKNAWMRLHLTFNAIPFDKSPFTRQCEKEDRKAKGFQIVHFDWSSFSSDIVAVKWSKTFVHFYAIHSLRESETYIQRRSFLF